MIILGRGANHMRLVAPPVIVDYGSQGGVMADTAGHSGFATDGVMERVFIIDDHPLVRDGLRSVVTVAFDGCEIAEASSLDEALAMLEKHSNFDLVLLDLNMPDVKRLDGLRLLRQQFPILPVAMVSGSFDWMVVQEAMTVGAAGFIPKSMKRSAIVAALHRIASGEIYLPESVGEGPGASEETGDILRRIDSLTPHQRMVLGHLVNGRLNKQIAHDLGVSMTTVKAHVSAILQKLGVFSRTQAVIKANLVHFTAD